VDQPFWGERVHALGAGPKPVPRQKLTAAKLGAAIAVTVGNAPMAQRASELAGKIAQEDGVAAAVGLVEGLLAE
jgi:sterol 3beta-glucosyltransferase